MAKRKGSYYFSHDFGARNDPKLMNLLMDHGIAGIGVYWCIIEMLYEEGGELPLSACKHIAFSLHVSRDTVESIVTESELFANDGENFWSEAVNSRISRMEEVAQKRRDAIAKRWGTKEGENTKVSENDTNVPKTDRKVSENDTKKIKENKRKEMKRNEKKINTLNTLNNNVVLCQNSESAAEGDTKQQGGIKKIDIEKYFFVERRLVQAERIAERFWNFNGTFDWQTSKGKVKNPMYAAKMWNPVPEEMGGHACTNKELAAKYFDFVKEVADLHPDAGKLLREFNNIEVVNNETTLTYNDIEAANIIDSMLVNNRETAFKAFKARFGVKTVSYITTD